jgi:hypothetical protein
MLNEASGSTTGADATGHGNSGTYSGATLGVASLIPSDATDTAMSVARATGNGLNGTTLVQTEASVYSLEAVIETPASISAQLRLMSIGASNNGYNIYLTTAGVLGVTEPVVGNTDGPTLSVSTVYHIVITLSGGTLTFYVNGNCCRDSRKRRQCSHPHGGVFGGLREWRDPLHRNTSGRGRVSHGTF